MDMINITVGSVEELLKNLKDHMAAGPDKLTLTLLAVEMVTNN